MTLCSFTRSETNCPATTSVSLLAKAISLPALIALTVGTRPAAPTMADTTMSEPSAAPTAAAPSIPQCISGFSVPSRSRRSPADSSSLTETIPGLNSLICSASRLMSWPSARPVTLNLSGCWRTTSSVLNPIDPVLPRIDNDFMFFATNCITSLVFRPEFILFQRGLQIWEYPRLSLHEKSLDLL